jgi:acyl CoA:acetate/3-ketoacid CoA transferase alpha subunit
MVDKISPSIEAALGEVKDGATVLVGALVQRGVSAGC